MGDSNVRVPPDSTGKRIDAASLNVGLDVVYRQRIVLADNAATQEFATITGGILQVGGRMAVSGTAQVAIATPFTVNNISATVQVAIGTPFTVNNISATVQVAGTVNISGTAQVAIATPIVVNNVSATVAVAGTVALAAGAANIGAIDHISRTVQVAITTPHTVNNISATVMVAITSGGGSGFSMTDGTSFTSQAAPFVPVGGIFDDTLSDALSENDAGVVRMTSARAFHVNLRDATGAALGTAGAALAVNVHAISATASVVLAAGAANIGTINDISRTVQVAIATPFTVNNISATINVVVTGGIAATEGIRVAITGTPSVVLGAGTSLIGDLNAISRTVQVAVGTPFTVNNISATVTVAVSGYTPATVAIMSASHGPKCVTASTSANVTLIASPGAGLFIYVTQLMVGNMAASATLARIGTSAAIATVVQPVAANGGGFVLNFDPPWKLSASEACLCSVKPNASQVYFTVNFYVGT